MAYIGSYSEAKAFMSNARSARLGRPLSSVFRMFPEDGGSYVLRYRGSADLLRVAPDNTATFIMPADKFARRAHALLNPLYRHTPFTVSHVTKGIYNVNGAEYHTGLRFDLATHKALNPIAPYHKRVDPDARRTWLAARKALLTQIKTVEALGAIPTTGGVSPIEYGGFEAFMEGLLRDPSLTPERLRVLGWLAKCNNDGLYAEVSRWLNRNSIALRRSWGVLT